MPPSKIVKGFELSVLRLSNGDRELVRPLLVKGFRTALPNLQVSSGVILNGALCVHRGFVTDFSSIPTPLQWGVRWSRVDVAGVVHDFLYRDTRCPRAVADDVWWELARSGATHVGRCRAWLCWTILRGCGWWNRPEQPERLTGWLLFAAVVLFVLLLLMAPVLIVTGILWLVDRL